MAFQNLRTGSTVYAFYKGNNPQFEIGQVVTDPEIKAKYPNAAANPGQAYPPPSFLPQPQEQIVRLSIKFGEKIQPIDGLSPMADIQDCGNGLIISCNREAINAEIVAYKQISDSILAPSNLEMHKRISAWCNETLTKINPEVAERQRLEAENKELRNELQGLRTETAEMKTMLSTLLDQLGGPAKK